MKKKWKRGGERREAAILELPDQSHIIRRRTGGDHNIGAERASELYVIGRDLVRTRAPFAFANWTAK